MANDSGIDQRRPSSQIVFRLFLAAVTYIIGFFPISWLAMRVTPQDQLGIIRYAYRPVLELLIALPDSVVQPTMYALEFGAPENVLPVLRRYRTTKGEPGVIIVWICVTPVPGTPTSISHTTYLLSKVRPP